MLVEKARWELLKDAAYCSEQILEAALDKTAIVGPLETLGQIHMNLALSHLLKLFCFPEISALEKLGLKNLVSVDP